MQKGDVVRVWVASSLSCLAFVYFLHFGVLASPSGAQPKFIKYAPVLKINVNRASKSDRYVRPYNGPYLDTIQNSRLG